MSSDFHWSGPIIIRKARRCIWCGDALEPGCNGVKHFGRWEGEINGGTMHPECNEAWENCDPYILSDGWDYYSHKRGTCEWAES